MLLGKLQAVQATMYMRARMHPGDGWANSKVAQDNYEDSLKIIEALRQRHGDDIDFMAPEHVPTGAAGDAFAPVEDGEESFDLLTVENPDAETQHQRRAVEYIIHSTLKPTSKGAPEPERLHMLLRGPGGCGKSVVVRASAHMLRQSGIGVIIAAPTGVAAWNINGVTLHSCCLLPVVNKSYGKACDLPLPCGPQLAALQMFSPGSAPSSGQERCLHSVWRRTPCFVRGSISAATSRWPAALRQSSVDALFNSASSKGTIAPPRIRSGQPC